MGMLKTSRLNLTDYASEDRSDVMRFTKRRKIPLVIYVKEVELTLNPDTTKKKAQIPRESVMYVRSCEEKLGS